jgi:hypothetical protein
VEAGDSPAYFIGSTTTAVPYAAASAFEMQLDTRFDLGADCFPLRAVIYPPPTPARVPGPRHTDFTYSPEVLQWLGSAQILRYL